MSRDAIADLKARAGIGETDKADLLMSAPTPEIKGMLLMILAIMGEKGYHKVLKAWREDFGYEWGTGHAGDNRRYYMRCRIEIGERRKKARKRKKEAAKCEQDE